MQSAVGVNYTNCRVRARTCVCVVLVDTVMFIPNVPKMHSLQS